jgi:hypothetical protein
VVLNATTREEQYQAALEQIRDLPTEHDLLTNAEVRYLREIAVRALEGSWGKPYEESILRLAACYCSSPSSPETKPPAAPRETGE